MKKMLFPFLGLLVLFFQRCGVKSDKAVDPKKNYSISMTGFDSLQLGMTKAELEAILDTTFSLKHIKVDGGAYDTFNSRYKGTDITIYLSEGDDSSLATLFGIQTTDSSFKTPTGIGVGSEKEKVIEAYTNHTKYIAPEYEAYPVRSKTKSVVAVMDTVESRGLIFHIVNRKVSSVELCSYYEFY